MISMLISKPFGMSLSLFNVYISILQYIAVIITWVFQISSSLSLLLGVFKSHLHYHPQGPHHMRAHTSKWGTVMGQSDTFMVLECMQIMLVF